MVATTCITPSFARQTEQLGGDTGFYLAGGMNITAAGVNAEGAAMLTTWDFRRSGVAIQVSGLTWTASGCRLQHRRQFLP